jgi:hypothetical protein
MTRAGANSVLTGGISKTWADNPLIQSRRIAIGFAQSLFGSLPGGSDLKWSNDIKNTSIVITDANPISKQVVGQRPAINCVRAPVRFGAATIDDFQDMYYPNGNRQHGDLISGTLIFNCCSENGYVAEDIAWFLVSYLWILRRNMLKSGFHDIGRGAEISAVSAAGSIIAGDSDQTWRRVSVILPMTFQWNAEIQPLDADVVNDIDLHISAYAHTPIKTKVASGLVGSAATQTIDGETDITRRNVEDIEVDDNSLDIVVRIQE